MPPRLARLLAVIVAVALIGGAFWWRSRDDGGGDGGKTLTRPTSGQLSLVCVTELADVCNRLAESGQAETVVDPAGRTAAALAQTDPAKIPFDAWITLDPWPQMVDSMRQSNGLGNLFESEPQAVASSPLDAVMPSDRYRALVDTCKPQPSWACAAGLAGRPWSAIAPGQPAAATWGSVKIGVGSPEEALGALFLGQLASSIAVDEDLGADPGVSDFNPFMNVLTAPSRSTRQSPTSDQLGRQLSQRGSFSLVAATAAAASRSVASTQGRGQQLQVVELAPKARADVVVASITTGGRADAMIGLFTGQTGRKALDEGGWTPGTPTGPNGMPAADVLAALREKIS